MLDVSADETLYRVSGEGVSGTQMEDIGGWGILTHITPRAGGLGGARFPRTEEEQCQSPKY